MAAPKGNTFWKLRTKHGKDAIFSTPEIMLTAAYEYFDWCIRNPLYKHEAVKGGIKAGDIISVPVDRPFTLSGLCIYLGVNVTYFNHFKARLKNDIEDKSKVYTYENVISHIEEIIYSQKFNGAAVGIFNHAIIARDLGLADKTDLKISAKDTINKLSDDQLIALAQKVIEDDDKQED